MAAFVESGMQFDLPDEQLFQIEKSTFYTRKKDISCVECLYFENSKLLWIEAKSSFPKAESKDDYQKNLDEIVDKFVHSFELFLSHFVGVNQLIPEETPSRFLRYDFSKRKPIQFILIVNCKKVEKANIPFMIGKIQSSFLNKFKGHRRIWNIDFIALDHETAIKRNLVKSLVV